MTVPPTWESVEALAEMLAEVERERDEARQALAWAKAGLEDRDARLGAATADVEFAAAERDVARREAEEAKVRALDIGVGAEAVRLERDVLRRDIGAESERLHRAEAGWADARREAAELREALTALVLWAPEPPGFTTQTQAYVASLNHARSALAATAGEGE